MNTQIDEYLNVMLLLFLVIEAIRYISTSMSILIKGYENYKNAKNKVQDRLRKKFSVKFRNQGNNVEVNIYESKEADTLKEDAKRSIDVLTTLAKFFQSKV